MTSQQRDEEALPSGWVSCPPGEVARVGRRLRGRRQRRQFLRAAVATAVGAVVTGGPLGLWWALGGPREHDYGGITCSEVMPLLGAYRERRLPPHDHERVRQHLALCPRCRSRLEQMTSAGRPPAAGRPVDC